MAKVRFNVDMSPELYELMCEAADALYMSRNRFVSEAVREALARVTPQATDAPRHDAGAQ